MSRDNYEMSANASNYKLQNVECKSLMPSCKISSRSPRFAKGAITNLSDVLRQGSGTYGSRARCGSFDDGI